MTRNVKERGVKDPCSENLNGTSLRTVTDPIGHVGIADCLAMTALAAAEKHQLRGRYSTGEFGSRAWSRRTMRKSNALRVAV